MLDNCNEPIGAVPNPRIQIRIKLLIEINKPKCMELADYLRSASIPKDREETELLGFSPIEVGSLYLFLVAICHQTSPKNELPLVGKVGGRTLYGWDYLLNKFEQIVKEDRDLLLPSNWAKMTANELSDIFADKKYGNRLSDVLRRTKLLNDLGQKMDRRSWSNAQDIFEHCEGWIYTSTPNLILELSDFHAYRDPVRKKSYFLLALMKNNNIWNYQDEQNLLPPVDYHEVRGHLRIGTVLVEDLELNAKLMNKTPVTPDEDIEIRQTVLEAIKFLAGQTRLTSSQLHYLFWNIFRSHCTRESPFCLTKSDKKLPERYDALARSGDGSYRCPFGSICQSATAESRYYEHIFETDFY